jgi:hypothetical protein
LAQVSSKFSWLATGALFLCAGIVFLFSTLALQQLGLSFDWAMGISLPGVSGLLLLVLERQFRPLLFLLCLAVGFLGLWALISAIRWLWHHPLF